ncbi:MAG: hypothetical protein WCT04_25140 [Planctomycetota bacterium]
MPHRFAVLLLLVSGHLLSAQDASKTPPQPLVSEERSPEWLMAIERLRSLPRPGDIQNAGIFANIGDVVETTPEQKAAIIAAVKAFDAAMVEKATKWEAEMKATRAEYEAKIIAALPDARRDAAKKALEYSHEQWFPPLDFEAKLRSEFLARKAKAEAKNSPPEELDGHRKELMTWIKTQRQLARDKNADVAIQLKMLLDPKEIERLNDFDKNKEVPTSAPKKK